MERLETKKINGRIYYYYSKWAWVDGKCRRVWQKYLGKLEDIVKAVEGGGPAPRCAEVFQWGLPFSLWKECCLADVVKKTDQLCPKRDQGLSTGEYLAIAALNRAISPMSKRSMWDWFSQTALLRQLPHVSKAAPSSQRFWDHMARVDAEKGQTIWSNLLKGVIQREKIDLSSVSYDGTNFYTFIDTFNSRCEIARRGKNKQGRNNLRQVSYALFCYTDGQLPLFYDIYEGNRNDAKQFPLMLERFHGFLQKLSSGKCPVPHVTLIFDKGNNSAKNFSLLDSLPNLDFVGSVKLDEHKELAQVSNTSQSFVVCQDTSLKGTKRFRVKKKVYGRERVLVVTYNQNLWEAQWLTLLNDISKAVEKLASLQQKLKDRADGLLKKGAIPTSASVEKQCQGALSRQHLKRIIKFTIGKGPRNIPQLDYLVDADALHEISDTFLGKNIIITNKEDWKEERIIAAYRSQFIIEEVFKKMKDRTTGSWWPLHHWTDSKVRVHGLYCTIAVLLRALLLRRVKQAGVEISMKRMLGELDGIREVVNIYPRKRGQKRERKQTVLTRTSEVQGKLISILGLKKEQCGILG